MSAIWGNYILHQHEQMHTDCSKAVSIYASWGPTLSFSFFYSIQITQRKRLSVTLQQHHTLKPRLPNWPEYKCFQLSWCLVPLQISSYNLQLGLRPQSKQTVYFLATQGRFRNTCDYGSTYTFLPFDGATQKGSYSSVCIMRKPRARWASSVNPHRT